jgi:HIV Tat-specific factor 1
MDVPFPTDVREFDSDERISFSKLDNKFIAVHDDGTEFEFDAELKKWVPTEEEPLEDELNDLREYSGTPAEGDALHKKRKHDEENGDEVSYHDHSMDVLCLYAVPRRIASQPTLSTKY